MRVYERELLRDVVRGGRRSMSCGELPITDIDTELEKVLPAHFELAIEKLETLSTKLTSSAITENRVGQPEFKPRYTREVPTVGTAMSAVAAAVSA